MATIDFMKSLGEPDFQAELLDNPHKALKKAGVEVPATTQVKIVRNSKDNVNMIMPAHSEDLTTLSDDQLADIVAGEAILATVTVSSFIAFGIVGLITGLASLGAVGAWIYENETS